MRDPVVTDAAQAAKVFVVGTAFLLVGAVVGLNSWPIQGIINAVWELSGKEFFLATYGFGIMLTVIFWASRPSKQDRWIVLFSWPFFTWLLWNSLARELKVSWSGDGSFPAPILFAAAMAIPATILLLKRTCFSRRLVSDVPFEMRLRYLTALSVLFLLIPRPALTLTATLHPYTFDLFVMHWDHAAGLDIAPGLIRAIDSVPTLPLWVRAAYGFTPLAFLAVALVDLRGKPGYATSALLCWVVLTACALVAYNLFPITGPVYVFGSGEFTHQLGRVSELPLELISVNPFPRNGMPSMHFGWMLASCILCWQRKTTWSLRFPLCVMAVLTTLATLYMGEHYVADLIVAVPFVLSGIALSTTAIPISASIRYRTILIGLATWLLWIAILRTSITWLITHTWACWLMVALTACVVWVQSAYLYKFRAYFEKTSDDRAMPTSSVAATPTQALLERRLGLMFFVSGAAALVYQVLFAKRLALVFGSTATATFTVLATFLGGMAIGSLIGGRLAARIRRPLVVYAFAEMFIAAYCILTPYLFDAIREGYVTLATGYRPDSVVLLVLRVVLGGTVLLVPTILMGATLPLLTQALSTNVRRIGDKVAWLYFANTAGAALGALVTSYAVIPMFGVRSTTLIAAMLNLLVALASLKLPLHEDVHEINEGVDESAEHGALPSRAGVAAMISLGVGGILSLGLEVVYVHMLSIVAGNSVYAFGLMLATFLIGLAGGGEAARRLMISPNADRVRLLAMSLLGLAIMVAISIWWWNDIPDYFASFGQYPAAKTFASRETIRGLVCALLMVPPTLFIGAAYALGMDIATSAVKGKPVVMLGIAGAVNTLGNISGVLVFGFFVLPVLGGFAATRIIAIGALLIAVVILTLTRVKLNWIESAAVAAVTVFIAISFTAELRYAGLSSGANVYFYPQHWGKIIDHAESIDGGLTTVAVTQHGDDDVKTLLTNGKFQGNDAWHGEMQAQFGFAIAPLLHQDRRDRALVIGYGTGVTSRVFYDAGFHELDIAELSNDVIRLSNTHFREGNQTVTSRPGVNLQVTDGRNLLLLSSHKSPYDVISMEISSIWFAGAASLYSKDFYSLAKSRLALDGVLQQWVQLHRLSPVDILAIISSLRAEFRYVSLYVIGGQGILVATNSAAKKDPVMSAKNALENSASFAPLRARLEMTIDTIASDRLLDSNGIDRFIKGVGIDERLWWSTDDNVRLEYSTPKANINDPKQTFRDNLGILASFAASRD